MAELLPGFARAAIPLRDLKDDGRYEWGTTFERTAGPGHVVVGVQALLDRIENEVTL